MSKRKLSMKWFGSLSNLSIRRSSDKSGPQKSSKHGENPSDTTMKGNTVDDMDSCLHSPGYVRSSDMYTHVGTVPRTEKKGSRKGSKKKEGNKSESSKGQGHPKAEDHVRESPLLSVLSSASLSSRDWPLPGSNKGGGLSAPTHSVSINADAVSSDSRDTEKAKTSPLHKPSRCQDSSLRRDDHSEASTAMVEPTDKEAVSVPSSPTTQSNSVSKTGLTQDVYVVMDPIAGLANSNADQETLKTTPPEYSQEVDSGQLAPMDGGSEYVKFSKEKLWLIAPTEKQRRELEEELKLSSSNLQSHTWYHGHIPWEVSETLVVCHGDFLVRNSLSSQGDYVLTSRWDHNTLHFLISKVLIQSSETYSRVQFTLEGDAFDSVAALVNFYVGNRTVLTQQSGAQIHTPVNRTLPLSHLDAAFSLGGYKSCLVSSPSSQRVALVKSGSVNGTSKTCPLSPSAVPHRGAVWSCGISSLDPVQPFPPTPLSPKFNTIPQHRSLQHCSKVATVAPSPSLFKRSGGAQPQPSPNNKSYSPHTPWTTRPQTPRNHSYPFAGSDTGTQTQAQLHPTSQATSYVERLRAEERLDIGGVPVREENGNVYFVPEVEAVSAFRPSRYQSQLMPQENKPLEMGVLRRVKELLTMVDAKTAAKHITKVDCMVARILGVTPEMQRGMGVSSGMELLTLPQGHQLRLDLLERFQTMSIMLAVDVLGCTGSAEERAVLLHKVIQMAAELKSNLGNMFGFAAIMRALDLPQISRLEQTWVVLRQRHTEGAILYEKTLKPFMKSLNDGKESCPLSNTCFPHVVPLLSLLEKSVAVGEGVEPWETVEAGVDVVMNHLGAARTIAQLGGIYHSNAETKLQDFQEQAEVQELFLTEFQMRLLWGSRGAGENQAKRYAKFDQVLTALSNKLEPPIQPQGP